MAHYYCAETNEVRKYLTCKEIKQSTLSNEVGSTVRPLKGGASSHSRPKALLLSLEASKPDTMRIEKVESEVKLSGSCIQDIEERVEAVDQSQSQYSQQQS
ncbi:hypothetical protein V6N12_055982 [Hibiscus sabdariffa]|uniref:Uncharacterized protein n=1 Tax=Hibiscus sabdariffa TaxID=183260 RepID=A0ABR2CR64_9ROSI